MEQINQMQYPNKVGYKKRRTSKQASLDLQEIAPTIRERCLNVIRNKKKRN